MRAYPAPALESQSTLSPLAGTQRPTKTPACCCPNTLPSKPLPRPTNSSTSHPILTSSPPSSGAAGPCRPAHLPPHRPPHHHPHQCAASAWRAAPSPVAPWDPAARPRGARALPRRGLRRPMLRRRRRTPRATRRLRWPRVCRREEGGPLQVPLQAPLLGRPSWRVRWGIVVEVLPTTRTVVEEEEAVEGVCCSSSSSCLSISPWCAMVVLGRGDIDQRPGCALA